MLHFRYSDTFKTWHSIANQLYHVQDFDTGGLPRLKTTKVQGIVRGHVLGQPRRRISFAVALFF